MNLSTDAPAEPATSIPPASAHYAAVVDQLGQTVQQLVLAALARIQHTPGPAGRPAGRVAERPSGAPVLSARERQVLKHLASGDSNKAIARSLELSPHTVKRHVANILDKLELGSRGQAAAWWLTRVHGSRSR